MHASASGSYDNTVDSGGCCGRLTRTPWSVWEIGAMVGGFVVFWPLGLLALFMKWKNGEMWRGASEKKAPWGEMKMPRFSDFAVWSQQRSAGFSASASGNHAFDDYRADTLRRLDEERRKLDEEQRAFGDFVNKLRRAKDQDEFNRFMAERRQVTPTDPSN